MTTIPESVYQAPNDPQHPSSPEFWRRELLEQLDELQLPAHGRVTLRKIEKQSIFLAALVRQAGTTLACGIARTSITAFKNWKEQDPIFAACLTMAYEAASDTLVFEARRRGVEGVAVTVRDKHGNVIGQETKFDSRLLIELLRGLDHHRRFSGRNTETVANKDEWRKKLSAMSDNPDALALMEQLADLAYGEKPKPA